MKVFIEEIQTKTHDVNPLYQYYMIWGRLQSGKIIMIKDWGYDLRHYINQHVEMLLTAMRSPYYEKEQGIESLFSSFEYYSTELIDEVIQKHGLKSSSDKNCVVLTGTYIERCDLPEKWDDLVQYEYFRDMILKSRRVINTEDGLFLLDPFHLTKKVPLEEFPPEISIGTGSIDLVAWHPLTE